MKKGFRIIDGVLYVDKLIFEEAQQLDNNVSKLTGSVCENIFKPRPIISTGVESVTINYHNAVAILIDKDPQLFVEELREAYSFKVRGHLLMDIGEEQPVDVTINSY